MRYRPLLLLPFLFATGCFYPATRGKVLEDQVAQLRADTQSMDLSVKHDREQLKKTLDDKISEVSQALESLEKAQRRTGADTIVQVEKTVEDVAQLRGQVDTYVHRIEELETALQKLSSDTDQKLTKMKGPEAEEEANAQRKSAELVRPTEPGPFLTLARGKAQEGESALARQLYYEFLKKWPKDPQAGDAHYGIGETYALEQHCREALSEYGKVIQDYPKSKSTPAAYLKSAACFRTLKLNDDAKLALQELLRVYPKSEAAKSAKVELANLDKATKKGSSAKKTK
jgi:tol-pal system protein YbgF